MVLVGFWVLVAIKTLPGHYFSFCCQMNAESYKSYLTPSLLEMMMRNMGSWGRSLYTLDVINSPESPAGLTCVQSG